MANNFLQSFLKTGLFDIGESDERLEWLQQSISELQKKFETDYSLLPRFTLVALDPNISDTEPSLNEVEMIVTQHWKALRARFTDMPINIHRGVILNALNNTGIENPIAARIIYLTALNFYPYAKLSNEKSLVTILLEELGEIAERNAIEEWSLIEQEPSIKLGVLKVNSLKFANPEFNQTQLNADLLVAIKNEPQGHGMNHGANSAWGVHYASKSSEAISRAFKSALDNFSTSITPDAIETPINKFFADFKKTLDANLKISFSSLTAVERRSKLLWWKETLYSPSLKKSYRELDKDLLPIVMGSDLNTLVPKITPISADYLLRDTLFLLNDKKDDLVTFMDYLTAITSETAKSTLKEYFSKLNESEGRISITDFIALLINDRIKLQDFHSRTGINGAEKISHRELAVAVFHDLLSQRLIAK